MIEKTQTLWLDGALTGWEDGTTHLMTPTLHYGFGAFEGIRSYQQANGGTAIFRVEEHIDRLFASSKAAYLEVPGAGKLGPVTAAVQQAFSAAAQGRSAQYKHWLTPA